MKNILFVAVLAFSLVACGGESTTPVEVTEEVIDTTEEVVVDTTEVMEVSEDTIVSVE